jgi:hypothetical protein
MTDNFINQSQLVGAAAVACSELLGARLMVKNAAEKSALGNLCQ